MSSRDAALLVAAGLSASKAAALFGRSRQAIHQGIRSPGHYFSSQDVVLLLHDAKRKDSDQAEKLMKFVETNYMPDVSANLVNKNSLPVADERDLILPNRIGHQQLLHVVLSADHVTVILNENLQHLAPNADFTKALVSILSTKLARKVNLVVPDRQVMNFVQQNFALPMSQNITIMSIGSVPCVVVTARDAYRAFVFGRSSIEEIHPIDAERLWWQSNRRDDTINMSRDRPAFSFQRNARRST